ncbi:MAG: ABC transporter ATP-binding protein [Spirochaetes bacterium]|nr:ABC transporter ATP-binding protein [Spirochaetota bacterium]
MTEAIEFINTSKIYRIPSLLPWRASKKISALNNISFKCPQGKITCLLGPNGAGKTTVIKILAGLVSPDGGSIEILGTSLDDAAARESVKIGVMASNDRSFYWRLTGRQNLEFFCALYGYTSRTLRRMVSTILQELNIEAEADKPFRLYSTGTKQKFLLARALLHNPDILLLDEPTSHIDPIAKDGIHTLIKDNFIAARKTTVLLCTHDIYEVQQLADRIILLSEGAVIAEGSPSELTSMVNPGITFTMDFSRMPQKSWAAKIPVTIISTTRGSIECRVATKTSISDAIEAAVAAGGRITRCVEREESIVDIFSRLTGGGTI